MDKRKTILVIEDHDSIRLLLGKFLSKNYNVTTKKDGFEGLAWLTYGNIPDLIILDMSMPRISGIEFLSNIKSSGFFGEIPVMVVTGEEGPELKEQCYQLGVKGYLTKPFNPIDLNTKIKKILQSDHQTINH